MRSSVSLSVQELTESKTHESVSVEIMILGETQLFDKVTKESPQGDTRQAKFILILTDFIQFCNSFYKEQDCIVSIPFFTFIDQFRAKIPQFTIFAAYFKKAVKLKMAQAINNVSNQKDLSCHVITLCTKVNFKSKRIIQKGNMKACDKPIIPQIFLSVNLTCKSSISPSG